MKRKTWLWGNAVALLLAMALLWAGFSLFAKPVSAAGTQEAETEVLSTGVDSGKYDSYTDTDNHGGEIGEYLTLAYTSTVEVKNDVDDDNKVIRRLYVSGDDPIVNFVPKELFSTVGQTIYVGKEYGFIVDSFEISGSEGIHSIVMVFDIERHNNMVDSFCHLKIDVTPLFQTEFFYFERGAQKVRLPKPMEGIYYTDERQGTVPINLLAAQGDSFVVPLPVIEPNYAHKFVEFHKYYLKDISAAVSLYNEHHINPYDTRRDEKGNRLYDPFKDDGAYFSQMDYAYSGKYLQKGSTNFKDVGNVMWSAGMIALDLIGPAIPGGTILSSIIKGISAADKVKGYVDLGLAINGLNEQERDRYVSAEKKLTYIPQHTVRDIQAREYGYLTKDALISVQPTEDGELLFGKYDTVTMDFQISQQDPNWQARYISALELTAVAPKEDGSHLQEEGLKGKGAYSDFLLYGYSDEVFPLEESVPQDGFLMLDGTLNYTFVPEYSGRHSLTAGTAQALSMSIYTMENGSKRIVAESNAPSGGRNAIENVDLEGGKTYYADISYQDKQSFGYFPVCWELTAEPLNYDSAVSRQIPGNTKWAFSVPSASLNNYLLEIGNPGNFRVHVYDGRTLLCTSVGKAEQEFWLSGNERCLVIAENTSANPATVNLTLRRGPEALANQAVRKDGIAGEDKIYRKIVVPYSGNYRIINSNPNIAVKIYNDQQQEPQGDLAAGRTYFMEIANRTASPQNAEVTLEFFPQSVTFGATALYEGRVRFTAPSTNNYRMTAAGAGVGKVLDYHFFEVAKSASGAVHLIGGETYYIELSGLTAGASLTIGVNAEQIASLDTSYARTADESGYAYYSLRVNYAGIYDFTATGTGYTLYDSGLRQISAGDQTGSYDLVKGDYYFRVDTAAGGEARLAVGYRSVELDLDTEYIIGSKTDNMYRFRPDSTDDYRFFTLGNSTFRLTGKIVLYNSNLEKITESPTGQYVTLDSGLNAGSTYYLQVVVSELGNQSIIFSAEYRDPSKHTSGPMNLTEGADPIRVFLDANGSKLMKFTPTASWAYYFFLDVNSKTDLIALDMHDGTTLTRLSGELLRDGETFRYMVVLSTGKSYRFLLSNTEAHASAGVEVNIIRRYDNVQLKYYLVGQESVLYDFTNSVIPACYKLGFKLTSGNTQLNYRVKPYFSNQQSTSSYAFFDGDYLVFRGTEAVGKQVFVNADFYHETYSVTFTVEAPFQNLHQSVKFVPNEARTANWMWEMAYQKADTSLPGLTLTCYLELLYLGNSVQTFTVPMGSSAKFDLYPYMGRAFDKIRARITLSANNQTCVVENVYIFDNTPMSINQHLNNKHEQRPAMYFDIDVYGFMPDTQYISVGENATVLYLKSSNEKILTIYVDIKSRTQPLLIVIDNAGIQAPKGYAAIRTASDFELWLKCENDAKIIGGDGSDGSSFSTGIRPDTYNGLSGTDGSVGIQHTGKITIFGTGTLSITGGNGGKGGNGSSGYAGIRGADGVKNSTPEDAKGKSGTSGISGGDGGRGGNGAPAIKAQKVIFYKCEVTLTGGNGGSGGNGGKGGNGGAGGNGGDTGHQKGWDAGDGGNGGHGGKGGNGGHGGNGATPLATINPSEGVNAVLTCNIGRAGNGGNGGYGGNGGAGGRGGADTELWGDEGNGGNGGDGGNGGNAGGKGEIGSKVTINGVEPIWRSNTTALDGSIGYGSAGGAAGKVGDPGGYVSSVKHDGKRGVDGNDGVLA